MGRVERFEGRIAGFGTGVGTRVVVGMWETSPFGRFADVMVEFEPGIEGSGMGGGRGGGRGAGRDASPSSGAGPSGGHRLLLAPSAAVAEYVAATYSFDEVRVVEVRWGRVRGGLRVLAGPLEVRLAIGSPTAIGRALRSVPRAVAVHPAWLRVIDPVARMLVPGARTSGSAGNGRREYYGVTRARAITSIEATWSGVPMGELRRLEPPVTFGFGSAPATPTLVDIVTSIRMPRRRP
nr:hypothetical protein [Subtercola boreus]